jgi:hypothetical protein
MIDENFNGGVRKLPRSETIFQVLKTNLHELVLVNR